jgi:hypothetical protein
MAKNLGGARVTVKVLLELTPSDPPPASLVAGGTAHWDPPEAPVSQPHSAASSLVLPSPPPSAPSPAAAGPHAPAFDVTAPWASPLAAAGMAPPPLQPSAVPSPGSAPGRAHGWAAAVAASTAASPASSRHAYASLPSGPSPGPSPSGPEPGAWPAEPLHAYKQQLRRPLLPQLERSPVVDAALSSGVPGGTLSAWPLTGPLAESSQARVGLGSAPRAARGSECGSPAAGLPGVRGRLSAEVSHAAAPTSEGLPAGAGALVAEAHAHAAAVALSGASGASGGVCGGGGVRLCLERALNLDLPEVPPGEGPRSLQKRVPCERGQS